MAQYKPDTFDLSVPQRQPVEISEQVAVGVNAGEPQSVEVPEQVAMGLDAAQPQSVAVTEYFAVHVDVAERQPVDVQVNEPQPVLLDVCGLPDVCA